MNRMFCPTTSAGVFWFCVSFEAFVADDRPIDLGSSEIMLQIL